MGVDGASGRAATTHVTVLGRFCVQYDGLEVPLPPSGSQLVALLAVHRRPMSRLHAAATLWPQTRDRQAAANLRTVLFRLRRGPARLVVADGESVALADGVDVDLWHAGTDLALLRADLLPGWPQEWLVEERERFRQVRLHALEDLCTRYRLAGEYGHALEAALAAVAAEPLRESGHRQVIEVHLAEGNHAEALRQFEQYRTRLRRELGIPPSPAIRELVGRLLGRPVDRPPS